MLPQTRFQIGIDICHITFSQCARIESHSSGLTNVENSTSQFCQSVHICCGEKEREENNGNCKAFCVRRKRSKLIIAHSNINSIRNKFDFPVNMIKGNVDIMMISETKLDNTFANGQLLIDGFYELIRLDKNKTRQYPVREDIPTKVLSSETSPVE